MKTYPPIASQFRTNAFLPLFLVLVVAASLVALVPLLISEWPHSLWLAIPVLSLQVFLTVWMIFGEMRTKVIKVNIDDNTITCAPYMGRGTSRTYLFSELDGYKLSTLYSETSQFEFLYLLSNGRKVAKLSSFYHSNYEDLKRAIKRKTRNLGTEPQNVLRELKDTFKL